MADLASATPHLHRDTAASVTNDTEKAAHDHNDPSNAVKDEKSPGVQRIEAIASTFTKWHKWVLFLAIFLLAYCYGLDGTVRYTLQVYALASFSSSAQISTVTVVRSIIAAAAQPVYAKVSDYFGRMSILFICVFFFVLGTIVQAVSKNVGTFSGGALLNQIGYTGMQLLVEVIIADTSSLRSRLFFSYIPAAPFLINTWISGNVAEAFRVTPLLWKWEWGIGMWAIIVPIVSLPLFATFWAAKRRASKEGKLDHIPRPKLTSMAMWKDFAVKADVVGLFLLAAMLSLILIPFTLAGGTASIWPTAKVITPLVVGFVVALPLFIFWEVKMASHPLFPVRLLRDRQIVCGLLIAVLLNTTWYTQGDYLYYTVIVAFDKPVTVATRVTMIYSFVSVIIGFALGLLVRYVRRLKIFIIIGGCFITFAFGLLIRYRGGTSIADFAGLVGAEVLLGIGGGLLPYPTQALVQSAVKHERTAIITSIFLASYSVGSALGNTIAAAIWTNTLPAKMLGNLNAIQHHNATALAAYAYADPFTFIVEFPIGTPERQAINTSYYEVQRLLCITGIALSVVLLALTFGLRDVKLSDEQSFEDAEEWASMTKEERAAKKAEEAAKKAEEAANRPPRVKKWGLF